MALMLSVVGGWKAGHLQVEAALLLWKSWLATWRSPWSQSCCCSPSCCRLQRSTTSWASLSWRLCRASSWGTTTPPTARRDAPSSSSPCRYTPSSTCITSSSQRFSHVGMWVISRCAQWPLGCSSPLSFLLSPSEAPDLSPPPLHPM